MLQWTAVVFGVSLMQCTSPDEPNMWAYFYSMEVPVVTGIYVTTLDMPDGTGETIGVPSYSVSPNGVNVFPNPYVESGIPPLLGNYLVFNHMDVKGTVVIIRAQRPEERAHQNTSYLGTTVPPGKATILRTLHKDDPSRFLRWDLTDDTGAAIPSGVYRAFYYGPTIDGIKFLDIIVKEAPGQLIRY